MTYTMHYDSPLGGILLAADEEGLTGLWFETQKYFAAKLAPEHEEKMTPALDAALPLAGCLFFGSGAGLHAEAPSRRLGLPAGGVGAAAEDPLRPDHDLRRAGGTAGRAKRKARLGTGGGRRCGAQPRLPYRALPPGGGQRRQPDRLCRRGGKEDAPADAGKQRGSEILSMKKQGIPAGCPAFWLSEITCSGYTHRWPWRQPCLRPWP